MSVSFELNAVARSDTGKGASRRLRKEGMVPGIVYGAGKDPEMISVAHNILLQHLDHEAFYSHILSLDVDGKKQNVVLKDLHRHPSKPFILHMDLLRITADEKLKMNVPLHFLGADQAVGVKAGGNISYSVNDVEVSCLPQDLPEYIEVDVTQLEIGDGLHLSDIKVPEGVEIPQLALGEDHNVLIVSVQAARVEVAEGEETGAEPESGEEGASGDSGED